MEKKPSCVYTLLNKFNAIWVTHAREVKNSREKKKVIRIKACVNGRLLLMRSAYLSTPLARLMVKKRLYLNHYIITYEHI